MPHSRTSGVAASPPLPDIDAATLENGAGEGATWRRAALPPRVPPSDGGGVIELGAAEPRPAALAVETGKTTAPVKEV